MTINHKCEEKGKEPYILPSRCLLVVRSFPLPAKLTLSSSGSLEQLGNSPCFKKTLGRYAVHGACRRDRTAFCLILYSPVCFVTIQWVCND
jgi:hypothetical protein